MFIKSLKQYTSFEQVNLYFCFYILQKTTKVTSTGKLTGQTAGTVSTHRLTFTFTVTPIKIKFGMVHCIATNFILIWV